MDFNEIMKQAEQVQQKMAAIQSQLVEKLFDGSAGGGLVKAVVSGKSELKKIDIANELLNPGEKDVLQDLIVAAVNDARNKVEGDFNSSMAEIASELNLPGDFKFPTS